MKPILPLSLIAFLVTAPAFAWERSERGSLVTWTFQGSEITSYAVVEPTFDEDPSVLQVRLSHPQSGATTIEIEADLGVADCPQNLRSAKGNAQRSVTLVADLNAQTLNGVTLAQCSVR